MIITFINMKVRPEKRKELWLTIESLVEQIRKEKGCVDSNFYQNAENENDLFWVAEWETRQALNDHLRSAGFRVLMGTRSLLSRRPEMIIHSVSRSSELEWVNPKTVCSETGIYRFNKNTVIH